MEAAVVATLVGLVALVVGVLIGRSPLKKVRKELSDALTDNTGLQGDKVELLRQLRTKSDNNSRLTHDVQTAETRYRKAEASVVALHRTCKNGDYWADHTEVHPEGMTPARKALIAEQERQAELERQRQAKRDADAAEKRAKARKKEQDRLDAERRKNSVYGRSSSRSSASRSGGYNDYGMDNTIATAVAYASYSGGSDSSYSGGSDSSSSSSSSCSSSSDSGGGGGGGGGGD